MATNDIGRITPIWRGPYSAERAYELNDIVLDAGGSVWWHVSEEITTGTAPAEGETWAAVIDMRIFGANIQAAIEEAQAAVREAEEARAGVTADAARAETAAQNAETSALNAAESAASVGAQAQAAERSAEAAAGSATGAAGSAEAAAGSATGAAGSAEAAAGSATGAAESAEAAAGSKSDAEAYAVGKRGGEDVGSTDPTYHNNAKYYNEQSSASATSAASSAAEAHDVARDVVIISDAEPTSEYNKIWIDSESSGNVRVPSYDEFLKIFPQKTILDQERVVFDDGADAYVDSLVVNLDYNSNGVSSGTVKRTGKNALDPALIKDQSGWNTFTVQLKPNTKYTVSADYTNSTLLLYASSFYGGFNSSQMVYRGHPVTWTTGASGLCYIQQRNSGNTDSFANHITQIEEGGTATELEKYDGDVVTEDWSTLPDAVYGGTWDVINGVITSTLASDGTALAEPVKYQITKHPFSTRYGYNTVSATTGNIQTIRYRVDIVKYIQSLL